MPDEDALAVELELVPAPAPLLVDMVEEDVDGPEPMLTKPPEPPVPAVEPEPPQWSDANTDAATNEPTRKGRPKPLKSRMQRVYSPFDEDFQRITSR